MPKQITPLPPTIVRVQTEDKRFYKVTKPSGLVSYYPSVTTILQGVKIHNSYLAAWREEQIELYGIEGANSNLSETQRRGTNVHKAIELWNSGKDLDWKADGYTQDEWMRVCKYMLWHEETQPVYEAQEQLVYSDKLGFAGTYDGIVEIDGGRYIIDFKTGKDIYDNYRIQASAYLFAHNEMNGGKQDLDGVIILALAAKTKKGWKEEIIKGNDLDYYLDGFKKHKALFDWANKDFEPKTELLPSCFTH